MAKKIHFFHDFSVFFSIFVFLEQKKRGIFCLSFFKYGGRSRSWKILK